MVLICMSCGRAYKILRSRCVSRQESSERARQVPFHGKLWHPGRVTLRGIERQLDRALKHEKANLPLPRGPCYDNAVKISDDYRAKVKLYALRPIVVPLPAVPPLPKFPARRFLTHAEMNEWKRSFLCEIAQSAARHG